MTGEWKSYPQYLWTTMWIAYSKPCQSRVIYGHGSKWLKIDQFFIV
jgi:hypothetical protein